MQRSIVDMGMKKIHLCFDKQLYNVTIHDVCWNQPRKFQNIVVHPARMYIIIIFACIGILMECPALEFYVFAVYGGIRGIYNGKSWMKAMRLFQCVAAALLQRFLSIRQLDNFLLPTLLNHQFEPPTKWEGEVQLNS